ncbi:glycosyltransferase family 2 protein [Chitinispirillales bacterium ANBcel5]|uniref:glycosyltransferase family 2 protein n=1 Tax=Cellulosispirillum alkaliphilum TaxID=3039283 RepID=UPI002A510F45|nr:glycosyltransferase family 2 protein [Chitinispirillales bacterium ANBcel5]
MKVSVVVPVYNVEKYIERCFVSVANQSYKNIECIFVDDCSPDSCNTLLQNMITSYNGPISFKIFKHEKNLGLSAARNSGTKVALGEYVYYLDSDDEITPNSLELLVSLAKNYPGVEMVQGNTRTVTPTGYGDRWRDVKHLKFPEYSDDKLWIKERFLEIPRIPVNAWNKLIKRSFLQENDLYFREGIIYEDEHWMFYVAKKISSIAVCKEYTYYHYVVPGSIIQSNKLNSVLSSWDKILTELSENIDDVLPHLQRKYIYLSINRCIRQISSKNNTQKYIKQYRKIIVSHLKSSLKRLSVCETFLLLLLFLPNTRSIRGLSKRLLLNVL